VWLDSTIFFFLHFVNNISSEKKLNKSFRLSKRREFILLSKRCCARLWAAIGQWSFVSLAPQSHFNRKQSAFCRSFCVLDSFFFSFFFNNSLVISFDAWTSVLCDPSPFPARESPKLSASSMIAAITVSAHNINNGTNPTMIWWDVIEHNWKTRIQEYYEVRKWSDNGEREGCLFDGKLEIH